MAISKSPADAGLSDAPPNSAYLKKYDYDGSGNLIYEGWAVPGTATSVAYWAIRKKTYDGSNHVTSAMWANGSTLENNAWDQRASLTYS